MKDEKTKGIACMSYKKLFKFLERISIEDLTNVKCEIMMPRQMFNAYYNSYKGINTDDGSLFGIGLISTKGKKSGLMGVYNFKNVKVANNHLIKKVKGV